MVIFGAARGPSPFPASRHEVCNMATDDTPATEQELEDLRREVERLRKEKGSKPKRWGRGAGAIVILVIAGILLPSAVTAVWANRLISSTDRYVQTVSPLAEDPVLQSN